MHPWVGLSNDVRLGAVARWVTPELVAAALDDCGVRDKKPGALPARFMVCFTLALALFQQDSYDDVAEHLAGGVPELGGSIPNKSSFTRARQRLGAQAIERVFRKPTGPLAPAGLEGSFYRGMRLAAVDGFVLDAPETEANRRRLGGPTDARGQVAGSVPRRPAARSCYVRRRLRASVARPMPAANAPVSGSQRRAVGCVAAGVGGGLADCSRRRAIASGSRTGSSAARSR